MYTITIYNNETGLDTSLKVGDVWFERDAEELSHDLSEMKERVSGKVDVRLGGVIANEDPEEFKRQEDNYFKQSK